MLSKLNESFPESLKVTFFNLFPSLLVLSGAYVKAVEQPLSRTAITACFLKPPAGTGLASGASAEVGVKLQRDVGVTLTMTPPHVCKVAVPGECHITAQSPAFPSSLTLGYQYLLDGAVEMKNASLLCIGDEMDLL